MKRYFCTYFNDNYLVYGLTMFRSLQKTGLDFKLFVLCLDDDVFRKLTGFDAQLEPVRLAELEVADPETAVCKCNRSQVEYFFTLSPALPLFLMKRNPEIDILAYVDSDFMFFSSPEPVFEELGEKSALIYEHDFSCCEKKEIIYGRFNVGLLLYRNNNIGQQILHWWREKCIEWCYDKVEPERFADQKYLDFWPELFANEVVVAQKTKPQVLAPWNMKNHCYSIIHGQLFSDGLPVICFHFQACKLISDWIVHYGMWHNEILPVKFENFIFHHYYLALRQFKKQIKIEKNQSGIRNPINSNIFKRSARFQHCIPIIRFWGNIYDGVYRNQDMRPWGFFFPHNSRIGRMWNFMKYYCLRNK